MGATVCTNKRAAAFLSNGKAIYILFEETYEKNCYPHTPVWGCICIGYLEDALKRIFSSAAACESGSLQSRRGYIVPENYISSWMKELKEPFQYIDHLFTMKKGKAP